MRPIVSSSRVALALRLPALNRSVPSSAILAEVPTLHLPIAKLGCCAGPRGTEETEIEVAERARFPALDSSSAARDGTVADAADGRAAARLHAQRAARTERREVMTQIRPLWPGMRTLTQLLRVA